MATSIATKRTRREKAPAVAEQWKTADSKGRLVLGAEFANRVVLIERISSTELNVKLARVIPEQEAWLHQNPKALAAVQQGLRQARNRTFAKSPNLAAGARLSRQIED